MAAPKVEVTFVTPDPIEVSHNVTQVQLTETVAVVELSIQGCDPIEVAVPSTTQIEITTAAADTFTITPPAAGPSITVEETGAPGPQGVQGPAGGRS